MSDRQGLAFILLGFTFSALKLMVEEKLMEMGV